MGSSLPTITPLTVSAAPGLTLDMGVAERTDAGVMVRPPSSPLVEQVITWLDSRPEAEPVEPESPRAAIATVLVCVRWGTWLARLVDPTLPLWSHAKERDTSCITDDEMARLNIEASYALGVWIELLRTDSEGWSRLAGRAVRNLPWPGGTVKPSRTSPFWMLADPRLHAAVEGLPEDVRLQARASLRSNPTRVLANAAAQNAWRNGPIEAVHAGRYVGVPLTHRRVPQAAEKRVLNHAAGELAVAIAQIATTRAQTPTEWMDTVLPFALPIGVWSAPRDWSTSEASRAVALVEP